MQEYMYIYGINAVKESLLNKNIKIKCLYVSENSKLMAEIITIVQKEHIPVKQVSKQILSKLTNSEKTQNVVLEIYKPQYYTLEELIMKASQKPHPFLLILDQIFDPHNFGAILRTCDMFGVNGVIILDKRQVELSATVAKTSAGGFNYVPICKVSNLTNAVDYLKKHGYWIYATSLNDNAQRVDSLEYDTPIALILGNEGKGVSQKLLQHSDFNIFIPTNGHLDSLNVSVAAGILIYQIKSSQQQL